MIDGATEQGLPEEEKKKSKSQAGCASWRSRQVSSYVNRKQVDRVREQANVGFAKSKA